MSASLPADIRRMLPRAAGLAVAVHSRHPAVRLGAMVGDLVADLDETALRNLAICLASYTDPVALMAEVLDDPMEPVELAIKAAARRFGVTEADVLSSQRRQEIIDARHVACYATHLYGMSSVAIGKAINKDHTTVLYGCSRVAENRRLRRIAMDIADVLGWERNAEATA